MCIQYFLIEILGKYCGYYSMYPVVAHPHKRARQNAQTLPRQHKRARHSVGRLSPILGKKPIYKRQNQQILTTPSCILVDIII